MEQKQRFFIYDRKEMGVLLLLGVMVAIFAFTLGVHLGKRVGPKGQIDGLTEAETLPTVSDKTPNRQEINEQAKGAQQAADESLNQALHDEVARTGIKMDTPRQIQLPDHPTTKNAGATTGNPPSQAAVPTVPVKRPLPLDPEQLAEGKDTHQPPVEEKLIAAHRPAAAGKFTLQIGSYPVAEEARTQAESLEALGLKPFMRPAEVKGKKWHRVYVGGFDTKDAAEKAGARYTSQHMIEAFVVSKMVE